MLNTLPIAGNRGGPYRLCRFPGPFDRMPETMLEAPARREEKWDEAMSVSIVWFRRDLRLTDNPALAAAAAAGEVVPVFCHERGLSAGRHGSPNRNAYLLASLRELDEEPPGRRRARSITASATPPWR